MREELKEPGEIGLTSFLVLFGEKTQLQIRAARFVHREELPSEIRSDRSDAMNDLAMLIRLARARLEGNLIDPTDIEKQKQEDETLAFIARVKSKLHIDTWVNLFPRQGAWLECCPTMIFGANMRGAEEQQFSLRPIQGGFELGSPDGSVPLPDDDQFNDRLLVAIGDVLEAVKYQTPPGSAT